MLGWANFYQTRLLCFSCFHKQKYLHFGPEACLVAIIVDKTIQRARPSNPYIEEYGWALKDGVLQPVPANGPLWPQDLSETVSCGHKKGCSRNCSCAKGWAKDHQTDIQGHNTLTKNVKNQNQMIEYYSWGLKKNRTKTFPCSSSVRKSSAYFLQNNFWLSLYLFEIS